jgi:PadR family transcriptional regulator PadR
MPALMGQEQTCSVSDVSGRDETPSSLPGEGRSGQRRIQDSVEEFLPEATQPCLPSGEVLVSVTEDIDISKPSDLVQGSSDMLPPEILALEPMIGLAVSQRLKQVSGDVLPESEGPPYPALHNLEQEGWITAEWKTSKCGRRAKYYLTRPAATAPKRSRQLGQAFERDSTGYQA